MPKLEIDENINNRFDHIYWSIYLYNTSLTELYFISEVPYNKSELQIVNSHPFDFYRITLQYCFIMEYNKLLEPGSKTSGQNISSLYQLNEAIYELKGKTFVESYKKNELKLAEIKFSNFCEQIKKLRDKKFAHADNHEVNIPFRVEGFKTADFEDAFEHLQIIKAFLLNCTIIFDFEYDLAIPNRDDRTQNFIKYHAEYKDYYFKHYMEAMSEKFSNPHQKP